MSDDFSRMSGGFSKLINDFALKTPKHADKVIKKAALELFSKVIMDTPVDTGRLRANWNVSIGSADESIDDNASDKSRSKSGSSTCKKAEEKLKADKTYMPIFLTNNMPYVKKIEYGGSPNKAPQGMVRLNMALYNMFLNNAIGDED
jgi:hypothetical protein